MYQKGWPQFLPFAVTVIAILVTDVLAGVLIGSAISVFFLLRSNFYNPFYVETTHPSSKKKTIRLELSNEVSFLNKPAIKRTLWNLPKGTKIIIDASFSSYIEPDIIEIFEDYKHTFAKENKIDFTITGLGDNFSTKNKTKITNNSIPDRIELHSPLQVLNYLKEGNQRFVDGNLVSRRFQNKKLKDFIKDPPFAVVINCIDMREPLNMLMNTGIGDLIPLKAAGCILDKQLIATIEMSCSQQKSSLIMLMGNSNNKLIKTALKSIIDDPEKPPGPLLIPAIEAKFLQISDLTMENLNVWADRLTKWNLDYSKIQTLTSNTYINNKVKEGKIGLCTAYFNRKDGKIEFSSLFVPKNE
jgi:carbonic anhydrase